MDQKELQDRMQQLHNLLVCAKENRWTEFSLDAGDFETVMTALEIAGEL